MTTAPSTTQLDFVSFSDLVNWSVRYLRENRSRYKTTFALVRIGDFLKRNRHIIEIQDDELYTRVTIRLYTKGVLKRDEEWGHNIGTKRQFIVSPGQFIMSKIDDRNGAFGLVPPELDGAATTADFLSYNVDTSRINPAFLTLVSSTKEFLTICQSSSSGTTGRQRVDETQFLNIKIPLPSLTEQDRIVAAYNARIAEADRLAEQAAELEKGIETYLFDELGLSLQTDQPKNKSLQFVRFQDINEWSVNRIIGQVSFGSTKFPVINLNTRTELVKSILRGKSPIYESGTETVILNQKCIRWNVIEIKHAKEVKTDWLSAIEKETFTIQNDVLINSTGDGTIGRSAIINEKQVGLMYDSHILCLRLNHTLILPEYFLFLFNSEYGQSQVESIKSAQSTKQTELGIGNLLRILIPLPDVSVQTKIVAQIELWNGEIEAILQTTQNQRQQAIEDIENELFAS